MSLFFIDVVVRILSYLVLLRRRVIPRVVRQNLFLSSFIFLSMTAMSIAIAVRVGCARSVYIGLYQKRKRKKETRVLFLSLFR